MQQLSLLRHAKALPGTLRQEDKLRSLSPRGVDDARKLGATLSEQGFIPDLVLCSSAVRTRETLRCLQEGYGEFAPDVFFEDDLYHASADEILDVCSRYEAPHIMVIGHNPGMAELYARLHGRELESYPTCTFSSFDMENVTETVKIVASERDSHLIPFVA